MELDRQVLKAISAETRLKMLKSLSNRKKMPSELQKEMMLSSSTVVEHLKNLESAGLIKRIETGHKWVYYELTEKGTSIVCPSTPIKFILALAAGAAMAAFSAFKLYERTTFKVFDSAIMDESKLPIPNDFSIQNVSNEAARQIVPVDWVSLVVLAAGLIIVIFSLYKIMKRKT